MPTPVRRIRYTARAGLDGAAVNRLRGALAQLGCRPYGPDVPLSGNAAGTRRGTVLRFEEGEVSVSWRDGVIVVYCELVAVGNAEVKAAIERELAMLNPTVVEDDGILPD